MQTSSSAHSHRRVKSWLQVVKTYLQPASLKMLFLGFSAGLPLLLVIGTLSFWLREAGVDRSTIGHLTWVAMIYALKWVWAPLVDRLPIPWATKFLGRRRSWLLIAQITIIGGLVGMSMTNPLTQISQVVWFALIVAIGSATQDIALDAFRIESADADSQGVLVATYQTGYRLAMIWAGAGTLWLAARAQDAHASVGNYDLFAWQLAYQVMAVSMCIGIFTVFISREPQKIQLTSPQGFKAWMTQVLIEPFAEFIRRHRWHAVLILSLIAVYRISDVVMGNMANPFYVDMGYTKDEVAAVTKIFGVIMTLLGSFIGGALTIRFGVLRILITGAILSAASNLLFAWLGLQGHDVHALIFVISADNLSSGIASAAFVAYLSSLTNITYSATQYALFSSMMLLLPKWLGGFSGDLVNLYGYPSFFIVTAILGLPVLVLIWFVARLERQL